jgi:hypothetical protein
VFFNANTSTVLGANLETNPPNGDSQRYVLVGTENVQTEFGVEPDFAVPDGDRIDNDGGSACFRSNAFGGIDCVSWGATTLTNFLPSPTGGNVSPSGIGDGMAIRRSVSRGCATLLEGADDTNNPVDWSEATPGPLNNDAPAGGPPCPNTTITKGPEGKTTDRTPTFRFTSTPDGADFECKLDARNYASCDSPHRLKRQRLGKHTLRVRAVNGAAVDPTPAKRSFKVVKK